MSIRLIRFPVTVSLFIVLLTGSIFSQETATSVDQWLEIVRNDGGNNGEFHVAFRVKATDPPDANTLGSATVDINFDDEILNFQGSSGWAFGLADGYVRNADPNSDDTGTFIRLSVTGNGVNQDGGGDPPGYDVEAEYGTWVTLHFSILDENSLANLDIRSGTNSIGFFENHQNEPNTGVINPQPLSEPIVISDVSLTPPDIYSISGTVALNGGFAGVEDVELAMTSTIDQDTVINPTAEGSYSLNVTEGADITITPSLEGYTFDPPVREYSEISSDQTDQNFTGDVDTFTISGTVSGDTQEDVSVTLSGNYEDTTTTDTNGLYEFTGVPYGAEIVVTPSKTGYTFDPPEIDIGTVTSDHPEQDFTANINIYTVSGTVSGDVQEGVSITMAGDSEQVATTGADGSYSFTGIEHGSSVTLTPGLTGYTFNPELIELQSIEGDETDNDFTAIINTYEITAVEDPEGAGSITGTGVYDHGETVTLTAAPDAGYTFVNWTEADEEVSTDSEYQFTAEEDRSLVANFELNTYTVSGEITGDTQEDVTITAIINGSEQTVITGVDGSYSFSNIEHGSEVTVTPSKDGFTFDPELFYIEELTGNQTANFIAEQILLIVSGTVWRDGSGLEDVTIESTGGHTQTVTTDENGNYTLTGILYGSDLTITPGKEGHSFDPSSISLTDVTADVTGQDFTATRFTYTIEGRVTGGMQGNITITVSGDDFLESTTTGPNGNYSLSGVPHGLTATITPTRPNFSFSPKYRIVENITADVTDQDFVNARIKLDFNEEPSNTIAGEFISPPVQVSVLGAEDEVQSDFDGLISIAMQDNPGDGTLSGTQTVNAVDGIATFSDLSIEKAGDGYTLHATTPDTGFTSQTSQTFDITHSGADHIELAGSIEDLVAGNDREFTAYIRDEFENLVTTGTDSELTIQFSRLPGSIGTMDGIPADVPASGGIATVSGTGNDAGLFRLRAISEDPVSNILEFDIIPGTASMLAIEQGDNQEVVVTNSFTEQFQVRITDDFNNPIEGATVTFTPPASGASGTFDGGQNTAVTGSDGVATAATFTANQTSGTYEVTASASGTNNVEFSLTNNPDSPVALTFDPVPAQLVGAPFDVTVTLEDQYGNAVQNSGSTIIDITLEQGNGNLSGTTSGTLNDGESSATISGLIYDTEDSDVQLRASGSGGSADGISTTSNMFEVSGLIVDLTADPESPVVGDNTTLTATVIDTDENPVPDVDIEFVIEEGNGSFVGDLIQSTDENGQASILYTTHTEVETATLRAHLVSNNNVASTVDVTSVPDDAEQLAFDVQPSNATAGSHIEPAIVVSARDGNNNIVTSFDGNVTLSFGNNPGDGELSGTLTQPASEGVATFGDISINAAGQGYTLIATAASLEIESESFNISPAAAHIIAMVSGDGQSAPVNSTLNDPLIVLVEDEFGNPVPDVEVLFSITSTPDGATGQTVNPPAPNTGSNGQASTEMTLGSAAGTYEVQASVSGLEGSPVTFTANATAGTAASIEITSGDGQSEQVTQILPEPFVVTVRDSEGNTVEGISVNFSIIDTPGDAEGYSLSNSSQTTDSNGQAGTTLTLGTKTGDYVTRASVSEIENNGSVNFTASATPGPATNIVTLEGTTPQETVVDTEFPNLLRTRVTDDYENPISGLNVQYAAPGSGSSGAFNGSTTTSATTDQNGVATPDVFSANETAGSYTVNATQSAAGSTEFNLTNLPDDPSQIAIEAGDNQSATVGQTFGENFSVLVQDQFGNPVQDVTVTFTPPGSGASGSFSGDNNTASTNENGVATATAFTANTIAGSYTVAAEVPGVDPAGFNLTNTPDDPSTILITGGDDQQTTVNTVFSTNLQVQITDQHNNPVSGVTVTFTPPAEGPGGSFSDGNTAVTNTDGFATANEFTANTEAGPFTVTASADGTDDQHFNLTNTPDQATQLVFETIPTQLVGAPFEVTITLTDQYENPVTNQGTSTITISRATGSGQLSGTLFGQLGDGENTLIISGIIYDTEEEGVSLNADGSGGGTADGLTGTSNLFAVAGSSIALEADPVSPVAGEQTTLTATVTDAGGSPIEDVAVEFSILEGRGSLSGDAIVQTNENGEATIVYTTYTTVETADLQAAIVASPSVTDIVSITSRAAPATKLAFNVQPSNTTAGTTIDPPVEVSALDENNNVDTEYTGDITVDIDTNPANGTLSGTLTQSAGNGVAVFDDLSINRTGNGYTLLAETDNLDDATSDPFNILTGDAGTIVKISGDEQEGLINTPLDNPFVVEVRDAQGNPVGGVEVTFSITGTPDGATGQELSVTTGETNSSGRTSTLLTTGDLPGVYEVSANADGVDPVTFSATVPVYTISGTVAQNGSGLQGVEIIVSGGLTASVTTNSNGNYTVQNVPAGTENITLTPESEGFTFDPESITIDGPVTDNITNQNFAASAITFTISGLVTLDGSGLEGVDIFASNGHVGHTTTNSSGEYTITDIQYGTSDVVIFPNHDDYVFIPRRDTVQGPILNNITDINFEAGLIDIAIRGTVTEGGDGLGGVTITASGGYTDEVTTNPNGTYTLGPIPSGATNVLITPARDGYKFDPADTMIEGPINATITNVNFITLPPPPPQLVSPADGATDLRAHITFEWEETERTDSYNIQVSTSSNFSTGLIVDESDTAATVYSHDGFEYGETYFWRVSANNKSGMSDWSGVRSFSTAPTATHQITLQAGWNMISSYIEPLNDSIEELFESIVDNIVMVKDGDGNTYIPEFGIGIEMKWDYSKGYQVYLSPDADDLDVFGIEIQPENTPIDLTAGWNMTSYLRNSEGSVIRALETIEDNLIIAKNGTGDVYIPAGVVGDDMINTLGDMTPGEGYQLYLSAGSELIYPANGAPEEQIAESSTQQTDGSFGTVSSPSTYVLGEKTGNYATVVIASEELRNGDEIGAWNESGELIGNGFAIGNRAVVTLWGKDEYNENKTFGAHPGEDIQLTVWSSDTKREQNVLILSTFDVLSGEYLQPFIRYRRDAVLLAEVEIERYVPEEFALYQNYPNPFNPATTIEYGLAADTDVLLEVYNVLGQRVKVLIDEQQSAGVYEVIFDGSHLSSGTYFYRIQAGDFVDTKKFILLK